MSKLTALAAIVCFVLVFCLVLAPFARADWAMYGGGPSHSNVGTGNPPLSPALIWDFTTGSAGNQFDPSPAVVNGVVYVGSDDHNVYALNATNGVELWAYATGSDVRSSPAVVGGVVYVGSFDDNVYALDASNGVKLWNYSTGGCVYSSPAVANGVVYVGSEDGYLYALNATDGARLWSYPLSGAVSSPAVANGVVYVGSFDDGVIYALNATTGAELWSYPTGGVYVWTSPVVVNGTVYGVWGGSVDKGFVYALNAADGSFIWSYNTGTDVECSPAVLGDVVYVACMSGEVFALDASSGEVLWNCSTSANISASPVVAGGAVYVGGEDGLFYALNASSGVQLWCCTSFGLDNSPAVVDGVVYLATDSDYVYALGEASSPTSTLTSPIPLTSYLANCNSTTAEQPTVDLSISGNITSSQMSNLTITTSSSNNSTTVSFTVTGQSGTIGFGNITIPISQVLYGTIPQVYIDGQLAQNQGYTQDANNYYVWFTTHFSTHKIDIIFTQTSSSPAISPSPITSHSPQAAAQSSSLLEAVYGVAGGIAIAAAILVAIKFISNKGEKNKN